MKWFQTGFFLILVVFMQSSVSAQLTLVNKSKSGYRIVLPVSPDLNETKAAAVLQKYIRQISGASLEIVADTQAPQAMEICIGRTNRQSFNDLPNTDGLLIRQRDRKLYITGGGVKGSLYAVYHFLEVYLGCRKFTPTFSYIPKRANIVLPKINLIEIPQLKFRQVYYPGQYDEEFQDWHKLQLLEEVWGLWGHTFDKLVPERDYFSAHPEYFALVNGERKPTQLCLSNKHVLDITVAQLQKLMSDAPEKQIWSVSQNDGFGFCTCDACRATDRKYGGPQGSLLNFVNKVADKFPDKTISTLAYLYSKHPPVGLKVSKNVSIMFSTIDVNRAQSVATDPRLGSFRNDLKGWAALTNQVMVWDYVVQFTNYISPFPNIQSLQANMNYFAGLPVNGAFIQGTENTVGEFSELKQYVLSKLSWNPNGDVSIAIKEFMKAYYGDAAPLLLTYQQELLKQLRDSKMMLDIYGDPVAEWNTWLTPLQIVKYDTLLDRAASAVANKPEFLMHVEKERLAIEYAVLQQARFYGIEKHGAFVKDGDNWSVKAGFETKVKGFIKAAKQNGVSELAEGGPTLVDYEKEWETILKRGPLLHKALGKQVTILTQNNADYPAKGPRTLTDGSSGYDNFQYNYLGWDGKDMEVLIDLGTVQSINTVSIGFLEDQRHWAFLPRIIQVEVSADNKNFSKAGSFAPPAPYENYQRETHRLKIDLTGSSSIRYLKIQARNLEKLPEWRDLPNRKSWLFCDEIAVY